MSEPVARAIRGTAAWRSEIWVDRADAVHRGDVLEASYRKQDDVARRRGRLVVAGVDANGRIELTRPWNESIPTLVADPDFGDWLYRVEPE